jgi:hypothetical protein
MVKIDTYLPSTNSPKLALFSSLKKDKLSDGLGVATMLSRLKSTHASLGMRIVETFGSPGFPSTVKHGGGGVRVRQGTVRA